MQATATDARKRCISCSGAAALSRGGPPLLVFGIGSGRVCFVAGPGGCMCRGAVFGGVRASRIAPADGE